MNHELFPSGPWTGFYHYRPRDRHRMDLQLAFAQGRLTGEGNDDVGAFAVRGQYDVESLECWWTKIYPGSHEVFYRGYREGKGIWGAWEITPFDHGGFHIWPRQASELEAAAESAVDKQPRESSAPQPLAAPQAC
ncbi:MAG: hypothetical protein KIS67_20795 [Verrucomicrobiae bacterium]|nr:hypothetical protein [Verrucomicrobiae bacterium]